MHAPIRCSPTSKRVRHMLALCIVDPFQKRSAYASFVSFISFGMKTPFVLSAGEPCRYT